MKMFSYKNNGLTIKILYVLVIFVNMFWGVVIIVFKFSITMFNGK